MRIIAMITYAALLAACAACGGMRRMQVPDGTGRAVEAMGVEFDPHLLSQNVAMRGVDSSAWHIACRRVEAMGLKRMRVMLMPAWYEPVNDNDDPHEADTCRFTMNSLEMRSLYAVLDLAERQGAEVTLVMWGCNRTRAALTDTVYRSPETYFLAEGNSTDDWCVPSVHIEEWCENISVVLRWLLGTKGYRCIREFTLMNEPSWAYSVDGAVSRDAYTRMCLALDARLRRDGLRDRVLFNLSDDAQDRDFLRHAVRTVDAAADRYNSHTYLFGYDTPNSEITAWERDNAAVTASAGKRHFIGEFGSNLTVGASRQKDIDRYERGVLIVRIALSLLNGGAAGVSYWSLLDQYYSFSDPYDAMQQLGLWRSAKKEYRGDACHDAITSDFEPRPQYYAYSLLTRHIPPQSELLPLDTGDEFVQASAFTAPDGRRIYAFANGSDTEYRAVLEHPSDTEGEYDVYRYEERSLPHGDGPIPATERTDMRRGRLAIHLGAQTAALYVQRAPASENH